MSQKQKNDTVKKSAPHGIYAIKRNIFCSLLAGMLLLGAVYLFSVFWMYQQQDALRHSEWIETINNVYSLQINEGEKNLKALLLVLSKNPVLRRHFLERDRDALLKTTLNLHHQLQLNYQITHFYFHTPDKKNFLRVHQPERHGDLITRLTIQQAAGTGKVISGIELGPLGTLTLRTIMPWYAEKQLTIEHGHPPSPPLLIKKRFIHSKQIPVNSFRLTKYGQRGGQFSHKTPKHTQT
ncbi:MAG: hypothetical protein D3924_15745, partial [Candidatus Electrothrix sp. AR4]|nr:hypothetical protein [Candidatus Electrothrix sp. AR4]